MIQQLYFWVYIQWNENRILIPCSPMFTAALFTIAKRKKQQPKCQSMDDEQIKMWQATHTHTHTHRNTIQT